MRLMATKNIYFIPFGQDDPVKKPNSMVARMTLLTEAIEQAINGKQLQPVLVERYNDTE
ncbi:MAG: dipicolinate synthase subunit B, partial [Bacillota bacterium]|nr:dipicolinate synthase subunit B [Bacillota bacterium]